MAIIGMGCLFPKATNLAAFWRFVRNGEDGISEVPPTHWSLSDYYDPDPRSPDRTYCGRGGFLAPVPFDPTEFGIPPTVLEATDTTQLLGLVVAKAALEDAGYGEGRDFDRERVSVILGVTGTQELVLPLAARLGHPHWRRALADCGIPAETAERVVAKISENYVPWQENSFPGLLGNVVAGRIANRLNLRGTNCVVDAACASSLAAVHLAAMELACGRCDMALTGGADTFNDVFMYLCFSKTTALSPTGDARPFAEDADGTVLGEGLGMLVLKRLEDAESDGDRIYAVIRGIGTSSDGRSQSIYAPHPAGQARALRNAYRLAGFGPESLELIEAHGTGTKVGDAAEFEALQTVFREARRKGQWCAIGSLKSQIGHTKAAAGAAGLIKAALAIHHRTLPPTIKVRQPSSRLNISASPFYLNTEARPWIVPEDRPRRAGVSSFGFGGSNFHAVIEEHRATLPAVAWDGSVEIIPLAAADDAGLRQQVREWLEAARSGQLRGDELAFRAATARRMFSVDRPCRLVIVHEHDGDLLRTLEEAHEAIGRSSRRSPAAGNVFYGSGPPEGRVVALFPGQGSQYVGMLTHLACTFPELTDALRDAEAISGPRTEEDENDELPARLSEIVYPRPAWGEAARRRQAEALSRTQIAQPALGATCLGLWRVLRRFGVAVGLAAGHSYGELVALCAAGRIDAETLHRLSRLRGRVMAESGGERGTMVAVKAPLAEIDRLVKETKLDVVVANRNAPQQAVLSGPREAIAEAVQACADRGFVTKALSVSGAFHSRLMEAAAVPFRQALETVAFVPGEFQVYANVTAQPYPDDVAETRSLLGRQLLQPVDFVSLVANLYAAGGRTFLEVGPKAVLCGLVGSILAEQPHTAIAVDASAGRRSGLADLARALALLAAEGRSVNLTAWERPPREPRKPKMVIPLVGANYRSKPPETPRSLAPTAEIGPGEPAAAERTLPRSASADSLSLSSARPATPPKTDDSQQSPTPVMMPAGDSAAPASEYPMAQSPDEVSNPSPPPAQASPQALHVIQEGLAALQRIQQQTAEAHQRFLDVQAQAQRAFMMLISETGRIDGQIAAGPSPIAVPREPQPLSPQVMAAAATSPPPSAAVEPAAEGTAPRTAAEAEERSVTPPPTADSTLPTVRHDHRPPIDAAEVVLEVVADKTGYPRQMIGLDMEVEADLGIDSIKRVEIMAAIEERLPGAAGLQPNEMGTLRTLREIAERLQQAGSPPPATDRPIPASCGPAVAPGEGSSSQATASASGRSGPPAPKPTDTPNISDTLLTVVAELTGYPREMLNLDMDMESDLGIDSIKRVEILAALEAREPALPPVKPEVMGGLRTLRQIVESLAPPAEASLSPAREGGPPIDVRLDSTSVSPPPSADPPPLRRRALRRGRLPAATPLSAGRSGLPTWLAKPEHVTWVTDDGQGLASALVARLGELGLPARLIDPSAPPMDPIDVGRLILVAPAVSASPAPWNATTEGFLKAAFALLKSCAPGLRAAATAGGGLFATVARLDGCFGLGGGSFDSALGGLAGLVKTAAREWPEVHCRALDVAASWHDYVAVSNALMTELAQEGPIEVGLTPEGRYGLELVDVASADEPLRVSPGEVFVFTGGGRGVTAECALALARRCRPTLVLLGRSPSPPEEPEWLSELESESAVKKALLQRVLRPEASPAELQAEWQRISTQRELRHHLGRLQETGARVVYRQVDVRDAKAVRAALQEITASYGPVRGLVHAAGVLADRRIEDKTIEQFAAVFDTKVVGLRNLLAAIDPMELRHLVLFSSVAARYGNPGQSDYAAANEVLNKAARRLATDWPHCRVIALNWGPWEGGMVSPALRKRFAQEGVPLISLAAGGQAFVNALAEPKSGDTEIILGGNLPPEPAVLATTAASEPAATETAATVRETSTWSSAFERSLDLPRHAFLGSHVLDGRAVLPLAMLMEWMGHAAVHSHPGLALLGLDHVRVLKGVIVRENPPRLRFLCGPPQHKGNIIEVGVEVRGCIGDTDASTSTVLHARGTAVLGNGFGPAPSTTDPTLSGGYRGGIARAYGEILFHGPHFQGLERIDACCPEGLAAGVRTAPAPARWMEDPLRSEWLTDPLAVDAVFQLGSLWCHEYLGMVSLPHAVGRYRQYRRHYPADGVAVTLRVQRRGAHGMTADAVFRDSSGEIVATLNGFECTADTALTAAFRRRTLAAAATRG